MPRRSDLPCILNGTSLRCTKSWLHRVTTEDTQYAADHVVVATGPYRRYAFQLGVAQTSIPRSLQVPRHPAVGRTVAWATSSWWEGWQLGCRKLRWAAPRRTPRRFRAKKRWVCCPVGLAQRLFWWLLTTSWLAAPHSADGARTIIDGRGDHSPPHTPKHLRSTGHQRRCQNHWGG